MNATCPNCGYETDLLLEWLHENGVYPDVITVECGKCNTRTNVTIDTCEVKDQ